MVKFELVKEIPGWDRMDKTARIEVLKTRIRAGIEKLNKAWDQIIPLPPGEEKEALLEKWTEAEKKLDIMCDLLKLEGFDGCLFAGKDGKPLVDCWNYLTLGCMVCPSTYPYWEESLFNKVKK